MKCPKCDSKIPAISLIKITRWTDISCGQCKSKLNRNLNGQFWVMNILGSGVLPLLLILPFVFVNFFLALILTILFVIGFYFLDYKTTKLIISKRSGVE